MSFNAKRIGQCVAMAAALLIFTGARPSAGPQPGGRSNQESRMSHVLLISIDGMHALDYENCVKAGTCPHLAELGETGMTYPRTSAARPSDSFPGLMALVTGGTPKTTGAYYDVAYDRILAPPRHRADGAENTERNGAASERYRNCDAGPENPSGTNRESDSSRGRPDSR